ncbi:HIT family protein [Kribbella sp. NPDC051587]|uniref:HIT family protein n=1 Tax=Kribbella sp. NPDC051587 TaxID=3364119 RepID=UPI0037A80C25
MDVEGCLGCDVVSCRLPVPGGILHQTDSWVVNHVVGPMNLGTLVLSPRDHVIAVAELTIEAANELGPLLRRTAQVVEAILKPEQTYVSSWAHGDNGRKHLHIVVQPVTSAVVAQYGGERSEQLQALMLRSGNELDRSEVEQFCTRAAERFRNVTE